MAHPQAEPKLGNGPLNLEQIRRMRETQAGKETPKASRPPRPPRESSPPAVEATAAVGAAPLPLADEANPLVPAAEAVPATGVAGAGTEDADRAQEAIDLVLATVEALAAERGEEERIWGSMVKQTLKRRNPGFNESYYGFRSFSELLEEAQARRLLDLTRDEKSGGFILRLVPHED